MYSANSINACICLGTDFCALYSFFSFHRIFTVYSSRLLLPQNVESSSRICSLAPRLIDFHVISRYIERATPRSLNAYRHASINASYTYVAAAKAITWLPSLQRVARPTAYVLMGQSPSANDSLLAAQAAWLTQDLTLVAGAS